MNITIKVSSTSTSGVTLICGPDAPPPAIEKDIGTGSSQARACLQDQTPRPGAEFHGLDGRPASSKKFRVKTFGWRDPDEESEGRQRRWVAVRSSSHGRYGHPRGGIKHRTQRRIAPRKKVNRIRREEYNRRHRNQRHQIQKTKKQNASHHHSQRDGARIPREPRRFARQHSHQAENYGRDHKEHRHYRSHDGDDHRCHNRHHNFHHHINRVVTLFRIHHRPQTLPSLKRANPFQRHLRHHKIFGKHKNYRRNHSENQHHKKQKNPSQNQWPHVLPGLLEPTSRQRERRGNSNHHRKKRERGQKVEQLPHKIPESRPLPAAPTLANPAVPSQHAVE